MPATPVAAARWRRAASLALLLGVWVSMVDLPYRGDVGFDMSWRLILHWAVVEPLAFGREFVFSYGPLGDLLTRVYAGGWPWDYLAAQALIAAVAAAVGIVAAARLGALRALLLALFLACFGWGETLVTVLLLLLAGLSIPRGAAPAPAAIAAASLCGVLAAARPTFMSLGALVTLGMAAACLRSGAGRRAAWLLASAPASFCLAWSLAGQSLVDLPLFLWRSLQYARGNLESMALEESWLTFGLGAGALALVIGAGASLVVDRPRGRTTLIACVVVWGFAFVKWKHGFVRADSHVNHFFLFVLALAIVHPLFETAVAGPWKRARSAALALAAVLSVTGSLVATPGGARGWARSIASRTATKLTALVAPRDLGDRYEEHWSQLRAATALPRSAAVIGRTPVDVVGPAQGLVLTNDLRYRPRPVFQSWAAYSGSLNRINESFYLSPDRPELVLQQLVTIDRRLPSQDDGRVLPLLLRDYDFVHVEAGHLLWRHRPESARGIPRTHAVLERDLAFGDVVELEHLSGRDLWLEADYRPSALGVLRRFLYKLPSAWIRVERRGGGGQDFRLLRLVAADGLLLSPHFRDAADWEAFVTEGVRLEPASFRITLPDGAGPWFGPRLRVRVSTIELGS